MEHVINFVWMVTAAFYSGYCIINMIIARHKARKGEISTKTASNECIYSFVAAFAYTLTITLITKLPPVIFSLCKL